MMRRWRKTTMMCRWRRRQTRTNLRFVIKPTKSRALGTNPSYRSGGFPRQSGENTPYYSVKVRLAFSRARSRG